MLDWQRLDRALQDAAPAEGRIVTSGNYKMLTEARSHFTGQNHGSECIVNVITLYSLQQHPGLLAQDLLLEESAFRSEACGETHCL